MPQPPNIDGLPGWLQVLITLLFGVVTVLVAVRGYRTSPKEELAPAPRMEGGTLRHLDETLHTLIGAIHGLQRSIDDHTHYERQSTEIERETNQRLRELKERLDRLPRM